MNIEGTMLEYQGDIYRDDRIYVINLSQATVKRGAETRTKWVLGTYRNSIQLPATRTDQFDTREEAIEYLKECEPTVPLISLWGEPLEIPEDVDRWEYWIDWLAKHNLKSAISGQQHVPDWVKKEGRAPTEDDNYQTIVELTRDDIEPERSRVKKAKKEVEPTQDDQYQLL